MRRQATRKLGTALAAVCALLAACFVAPAASAACPNEALREAQGATALPGCLALEMASFAHKSSQPALVPSFSRDGERLLIKRLKSPVPGAPGYQHFDGDAHVASRGAQGWAVVSAAPPASAAIIAGGAANGNPSIFTPDLGAWAQLGATQAQEQAGVARIYRGALDGSFAPLSPLLVPFDEAINFGGVHLLQVNGSSADLSTTVFRVGYERASVHYFAEDPRSSTATAEPGGDRNSYVAFLDEAGEPALELLARDKEEAVWGGRCGAHVGGGVPAGGSVDPMLHQGAISREGSQVFLSTRPAQEWDEEEVQGPPCDLDNGVRILERVATPAGPVITEIAPGGGGPAAPGDDIFQAASEDGTKVYFTSPRKLTASDTDAETDPCSETLGASEGCDLYLYDSARPVGDRIVQASAGPEPADVLSAIPAVSGDGSRAYFVAQGALSADTNPEGASAVSGQPNLYLYEAETESLSFIGTLAPGDAGGMWGTQGTGLSDAAAVPLHGPGLEGGGDGHVLAFASKATLTADDGDGGFRDVFRYDAEAGSLERVSKAAAGGADDGAFDVDVNPALKGIEYNFNETTRWASEDGEILAFATEEPLLPGDGDEAMNPYVWDAGELGAVLAPIFEAPAAAPVGGQIAFSTVADLLPRDIDTAPDVYVAREGGGFPEAPPPPVCDPLSEGSCQGPPSAKPGAVPAPVAGANVKEPTKKKCKKGFVKRKGKCVKKPRKGKAGKRANQRRGGSR